jgi:hypothetical protein
MFKTLDKILYALEFGAEIVAQVGAGGPAGPLAGLADYFLKIAQAAVKAHEGITGKPFDPNMLHEIQPVQ